MSRVFFAVLRQDFVRDDERRLDFQLVQVSLRLQWQLLAVLDANALHSDATHTAPHHKPLVQIHLRQYIARACVDGFGACQLLA